MKLSYVRSDAVYKKIMEAPVEKKNDIYRYELMMPFKGKWDCYQIPMKAATPNGYDIIMASDMLGFISPTKVDQSQKANIESLSSDRLWVSCEQSIRRSLECFLNNGIELPVSEYLFTVLLANAESPYISLNEGYCGDGGIPGYIMAWLIPNEFTLTRLPVALAHEVNHNVRFQFIKWRNSTLGGHQKNNPKLIYAIDFDVTPHQLRHTYITNLLYAGVDPKTVQYLAGHENSKTTMDIYAQVKYNKPEELLSVVNAAFRQ